MTTAIESVFFCFLIVITGLGLFFWRRLALNGPTIDARMSSAKPFGLIDVIVCFFAWIGIPGLVSGLLLGVFRATSWNELDSFQVNILTLTVAVSQILALVTVMGWACWKYGPPPKVFGIDRKTVMASWSLALKSFAMVVPGLFLIQWLLSYIVPYEHSTLDHLQESYSYSTILVSWIGAAIAAPFCEEVFFRGFLQGWLQRIAFTSLDKDPVKELMGGWPDGALDSDEHSVLGESHGSLARSFSAGMSHREWFYWCWPIVVSSLLFAAVHIGQGLAPIVLFIFGLVLGFLYRWTGSIMPAIYLHFSLNAFTLFWATLGAAFADVSDGVQL